MHSSLIRIAAVAACGAIFTFGGTRIAEAQLFGFGGGHHHHSGHHHHHGGGWGSNWNWGSNNSGWTNNNGWTTTSWTNNNSGWQTYYSAPQTTYYSGETHSHNHAAVQSTSSAFGSYSHIDDLTIQLSREANLLCLELHYNFQHNPGFSQTYREAYEILTTANYLHGLEHSGNRERMRTTAIELDGLFHHVQGDVVAWTAHAHRQVGYGGLEGKLNAVENTLHHLMNDVGAASQAGAATTFLDR